MAIIEKAEKSSDAHDCYSFTLILLGIEEITDEIEGALFQAGCTDALLGMQAGSAFLAFDRDALSLDEAITSAIKEVEGCGLEIEVVRVVPAGADTIEAVNGYLRLRRKMLAQIPKGAPDHLAQKIAEFLQAMLESNPEALKHALSDK